MNNPRWYLLPVTSFDNPDFWIPVSLGAGEISVHNDQVKLGIKTSEGKASLFTPQVARYLPRTNNIFYSRVKLPVHLPGVTGRWGIFDEKNGLFFQYKNFQITAFKRKNGEDIPLNPGKFKAGLDPKFHAYEISYTANSAAFYHDSILLYSICDLDENLCEYSNFPARLEVESDVQIESDFELVCSECTIYREGHANFHPMSFSSKNPGIFTLDKTAGCLTKVTINKASPGKIILYDGCKSEDRELVTISPEQIGSLVYELSYSRGLVVEIIGDANVTVTFN